ncbi:MAG: SpoVT / AbrB like domain protein [Verrucomicrobiales bacterium]|nr:SpoVT / AbrB like domain protein [Verrucomicrobiales bacterium]
MLSFFLGSQLVRQLPDIGCKATALCFFRIIELLSFVDGLSHIDPKLSDYMVKHKHYELRNRIAEARRPWNRCAPRHIARAASFGSFCFERSVGGVTCVMTRRRWQPHEYLLSAGVGSGQRHQERVMKQTKRKSNLSEFSTTHSPGSNTLCFSFNIAESDVLGRTWFVENLNGGGGAEVRKEAGLLTGDVVSVRPEGDGRILLVRLEQPKMPKPVKAKIIYRKGKHPVGDIRRTITREEIKKALADFP